MTAGSFSLVLHSHIPYIKKAGMWPFGEEWLYEAICETYIPLLKAIDELGEERYEPRLTINITPVLIEQLRDPYIISKFERYLFQKIDICAHDMERFRDRVEFKRLAAFYQKFYTEILNYFEDKLGKDIIGAFREFQDRGYLEIITSAATHAYLPLLKRDSSIRAQIQIAVKTYKDTFGRYPKGFWLPECAYRPGYDWTSPFGEHVGYRKGIEEFLTEAGLEYFFVDYHTLTGNGSMEGVYSSLLRTTTDYEKNMMNINKVILAQNEHMSDTRTTYLPHGIKTSQNKVIAVFGRNERTGLQVWSSDWGYPGNGLYREFHKKDPISGLQYWRITSRHSDLGRKEIYNPQLVKQVVEENSEHFVNLVYELLTDFKNKTHKDGIIVSPYDTELFGHWWFEGVEWLKSVLKKARTRGIDLTTCGEYLSKHPPTDVISLPESSWGEGKYHKMWLNEHTEWMWKLVFEAEERFARLVIARADSPYPEDRKLLDMAARELLLIQSSDWLFLTSTWQAREYAARRISEHYKRFSDLCDAVEKKVYIDYENIYDKDSLFRNIDYHVFLPQTYETFPAAPSEKSPAIKAFLDKHIDSELAEERVKEKVTGEGEKEIIEKQLSSKDGHEFKLESAIPPQEVTPHPRTYTYIITPSGDIPSASPSSVLKKDKVRKAGGKKKEEKNPKVESSQSVSKKEKEKRTEKGKKKENTPTSSIAATRHKVVTKEKKAERKPHKKDEKDGIDKKKKEKKGERKQEKKGDDTVMPPAPAPELVLSKKAPVERKKQAKTLKETQKKNDAKKASGMEKSVKGRKKSESLSSAEVTEVKKSVGNKKRKMT
ncbi:MAG: 1,4-alpha-glucan branching protein domain-containing protein [Thermoplasmata archaeon]